jgi:hypothetical protein
MTNEELFALLAPIIMEATGVPEVMLADDKGGSPKGEYASLFPRQTVAERGQANIYRRDKPDNKVETEVRAQIIATCSVNFFRGNAHMYAERLKQCNKHPNISMMLKRAKLGWNGADSANDLTTIQSANWEPRAQINIRIMYEAKTFSEINNILSARVIIENEKAQTLQTIDVP